MKYGCIGEHLGHSFSKEIHEKLADYEYDLFEIAKNDLHDFMIKRDFLAINVTIPYKQDVIKYLDYIDDTAKMIGAVNTIVNKNGKLYGYNTDFSGMSALSDKIGIDMNEKKVLILGTGGTSKTANAVAVSKGAKTILKVSRSSKDGVITYDDAIKNHNDANIVINTTPSGMFPNNDTCPIDIDNFPQLEGVIDAVYNPLKTKLIQKALSKGIKAEGGLYMLVAQAVFASEWFLDKNYSHDTIDKIYNEILFKKQNIVLTGMPSCGKSTVGKILKDITLKEFLDTDKMVVDSYGMEIPEIFEKYGEKAFRDAETKAIKIAGKQNGVIIATGGGAVLRPENINALKSNGKIYFLDRPLNKLIPTEDRPLAKDITAIKKRYDERYDIYCATADIKVDASLEPMAIAMHIKGEHGI